MIKEEVTYTDYDDNVRTETFRFNLNKAELTEMEASIPGGLFNYMAAISAAKDVPKMMEFFQMLLEKSYGEKTPDGRRLAKSETLFKEFKETPAYDIIFQKIFTGEDSMYDFFIGIMPSDVQDKLRSAIKEQKKIAQAG